MKIFLVIGMVFCVSGCTNYYGVNYGHEAVDAFSDGFFYSRDQVRNVFEAVGRDIGKVTR